MERPIAIGRLHRQVLGCGLVFLLMAIIGQRLELSPWALAQGTGAMLDLLARTFPPNWDYAPRIGRALLETIAMALLGTTAGVLIAVPLALLAARNVTPPVLFLPTRGALSVLRTLPEILVAVLIVRAVGIGPLAGVLGLTIFTAPFIAKLFSESVEAVDRSPLEALEAAGARGLAVVRYGLMPQVMPQLMSYSLYAFEVNIRAATVLGLVGAGGIGVPLFANLRLFNYHNVSTILLLILSLVLLVDVVGTAVRRRIA